MLGALLSACSAGRVPDDELVVLIELPPATADPRFAVGAYDFKLSRLIYAPLVSVDNARVEPRMELAESVAMESPTRYLVTIRADARFSDGKPVTASDVVYTYDSARDPQGGSRLVGRFADDGLERIEILDERRLRFVLAHAHAPFLTDLDVGILERPAPAGAALAATGRPVGAGPFVVEEQTLERWRLVPNRFHAGGVSSLRALTFKVIRDDNSRLLALVGGSGDLTQNTISPLLLDAVEQQPRLRVEASRSATFSYLGLHCEDPILSDVRVRRALAYAIDRQAIVDAKLGGRAVLSTGMLPPVHWAHSDDVPTYAHDPARARALLDEAGHPDPDGAGPRPRFTLSYKTSNTRFRVAIAEVLRAQLAEVGIALDVHPLEFATFFADVKAGNYQMFLMQVTEVSEPDLFTNFYASDRIPTRESPDRGANRTRYRSDTVDELLKLGRRELDRKKRATIYGEVQRQLARDLPVIPLWHDDNVAVMTRRVSGYEVIPTAQMESLAHTRKLVGAGR